VSVGSRTFDLDDLSSDWSAVTPDEARRLTTELRREMPDGHPLNGVSVEPVARHRRGKEALFWLPDSGEWAWVHLTGAVETDAYFPSVERAQTWEAMVGVLVEAKRG
jgi:hypothetical protein